ncbi:MAG: M28 family peptidase [Bacteroidaceae bacterium]|nr:M28 family peptidase [Bacteroidaceae bacterium]
MKNSAIILTVLFMALSCGGRKANTATSTATVETPQFCADSAYNYIKAQTDFGPRVPNTKAHDDCGIWLGAKLSSFGADKVYFQEFDAKTFDGNTLKCQNIIGSFNVGQPTRIILCSHWDSRPWADNDPDPANWMKPVDAANDGASGVGVILEIARQMQKQAPEIGVDCIFLDAEDWGPGETYQGNDSEKWWGLGTQYWAKHPHVEGYRARYAILLDMVGGKGAVFCREGYSIKYGRPIVEKVWSAAGKLGFGSIFPPVNGGYVTDDHYYINTMAKIPAIDIVPYLPNCMESSFGPTWHTTHDNIDNIDKKVLEAVGKTLIQVIYNEKP